MLTDWFDLLEARRILIERHLRDMTLKSLGDLKIIDDGYGGRRTLQTGGLEIVPLLHSEVYRQPCTPKTVSLDFPLETRGIFSDDEIFFHGHFNWDVSHISHDGVLKFWGLTRNNQWVRVEVTTKTYTQVRCPEQDLRPMEVTGVEKVFAVESSPSEIQQLHGFTPQWIWQRLGDAVKKWSEHRQKLLSETQQLARIIAHEEVMLGLLKK